MKDAHDLYMKWREQEAFAVAWTPEGVQLSQHRWKGFKAGYERALKDVVAHLMALHRDAQDGHNFYHVAANKVMELKNESRVSSRCA